MKLLNNLVVWYKNKQIDMVEWTGIEGLKYHWILVAFFVQGFLYGLLHWGALCIGLGWAICAMIQQVRLDRQEAFKKKPTKDPPKLQGGSMCFAFFLNLAMFTICMYLSWKREVG